MFSLPQEHRYILCAFSANAAGKTEKYPIHPTTLKTHSAFDEDVWMSLEKAEMIASTLGDGYGIGFVFILQDKYFFIDLDNCLSETGEWLPLVAETIALFKNPYIEVSQSGRGIHIIGQYENIAPFHTCKNIALGMELYTSGRFCAITKRYAKGDARSCEGIGLFEYIKKYQFDTLNSQGSDDWTNESIEGCNPPDDNNEVLRIILKMPKGAREVFDGKKHADFNDLFSGNETELARYYPSQSGDTFDRSSADSALAYRLHYFLGGNCERVKQLMEDSGLVREKWERSDYLQRTILSARSKQSKFFAYHRQANNNTSTTENKQNYRVLEKNHYPELNDTFTKPLDTTANLKFLLDKVGISIRWNDMTRIREIKVSNVNFFRDDEENDALGFMKDLALLNGLPILRIDEHLDRIAQQNNYHPIAEAITNNPWDGVSRLDDFIKTLKTTNDDLSKLLIRRWMLCAIAAAFSIEGFSSHGILVLVGEQSLGKTAWIKALDPLKINAVREGGFLDPTSKDCLIIFASFWIIELGELDGTLRKTDIARLKSHITSSVDVVRKPYAKKESRFARRTVYSASVNDSKFLVDVTGNRRFWTIPVTAINNNHGLDMLQVWAEVYHFWKLEKQTWLTYKEESLLNNLNKDHEQIEPFEEKLLERYDFSQGWDERETEKRTSTGILNSLGYQNVSRSDATRMSHIIKKHTKRDPNRRFHTVPKYIAPK